LILSRVGVRKHRFKCSMARMPAIGIDGEKLVAQLEDIAIPALKKAQLLLLFIFDNSSGHSVYAPDSLSAAKKIYQPFPMNIYM
jgi:hypothetical protein